MAYKIDQQLRDDLQKVLSEGINEEGIKHLSKQVSNALTEAHTDFENRLQDYLAYNLAYWVADMAENAVEKILSGDEALFKKFLSCDPRGWTGRDENHPVIHGKLFETGCLELRKRIVEAYPDLLKNERILDLEDQVRSLVEQNNRLEQDKLELIQRWNSIRTRE